MANARGGFTMEIGENGYLVPNVQNEATIHSETSVVGDESPGGALDDTSITTHVPHIYEHLKPSKGKRGKGKKSLKSWSLFGGVKRKARTLGPAMGLTVTRSIAFGDLDPENHPGLFKPYSTKRYSMADDSVNYSDRMDDNRPSSYSWSTVHSSVFQSPGCDDHVTMRPDQARRRSGLGSPLSKIPSVGSLVAVSTPSHTEMQPSLPPRRMSQPIPPLSQTPHGNGGHDPLSRSVSDSIVYPPYLANHLLTLQRRVEYLERRLSAKGDANNLTVVLDEQGESSTDDASDGSDNWTSLVSHTPTLSPNATGVEENLATTANGLFQSDLKQAMRRRKPHTKEYSTTVVAHRAKDSYHRSDSGASDNVFIDDSAPNLVKQSAITNHETAGAGNAHLSPGPNNLGTFKVDKSAGPDVSTKIQEGTKQTPNGVDSLILLPSGESSTDDVDDVSDSTSDADHSPSKLDGPRVQGHLPKRAEQDDAPVKKRRNKMAMELPFGRTSTGSTLSNGSVDSLPSPGGGGPEMGDLINIRIRIPDTEIQKSVCFRKDEKIWKAKQHLLQGPDVELNDSRNYGFYLPPQNNKAGKFLDEERVFSDYPLDSRRAYLEFRYKKRVYRQMKLDVNQLKKYHTKSNLKLFLDHVRNRQVEKMSKMTDKGLDPNFHDDVTGETPLTIATMMERPEGVLKALVNGGAHLDFRNRQGFTPVHVAVVKENIKSLDILLDLGASPDSKDDKGLTPLHYSIVQGKENSIIEILLKDCAELTMVDSQGWGIIHHACRYGRTRPLKLLLLYGADISITNEAGNTPLHVSALYNHETCANVLLERGADRGAKNKANQTPFQVAILANNFELAEMIRNHHGEILGAYSKHNPQDTPTYSKRRRWANYISQSQSLSQVTGGAFLAQNQDMYAPRTRLSLATIPGSPERVTSNGTAGMAPMIHRKVLEAPKGKHYMAKQNYSAQEAGELTLHRGDFVEVTAIGEYNYWQGSVGHCMGWFPSYCVEEVSPKNKKSQSKVNIPDEGTITKSVPSFDGGDPQPNSVPRVACVRRGKKGFGFILRGAKSAQGGPVSFTPTKDFPALQYLEHVDKGSPADKAGLKMGDFVLEINGEDVVMAPHQYVVNLVVNSPDTIVIKVITVPGSKAYAWLKDSKTMKRPAATPSPTASKPPVHPASVSSLEQKAVDELDNAIESGNSTPKYVSPAGSRSPSIQEDGPKVASIRKRPVSHKISPQQLDSIFHRQGSTSSEGTLHSAQDDGAIPKPSVPVPPMNKYNTVARMSSAKSLRQRSLEEASMNQEMENRRNSAESDSAVSSLRSSPASSHSYITTSSTSATDSAVHLKAERTSSDPSIVANLKNGNLKTLQGTGKKPSPLPPTRSQSLLNLAVTNLTTDSVTHVTPSCNGTLRSSPKQNGVVAAKVNSTAIPVEVEVHASASGNDSDDDTSSTGSFASAIALAAAKMEKKKNGVNNSSEEKPKTPSAFEMAMAAKQNYSQQIQQEGQNLNRNQNQNVESPSSTQAALQEAIAKRKKRMESSDDSKPEDIEERIRRNKQQNVAMRPKTGQAALLDAIAKRRTIVESQSPSSEEESSSDSSLSSPPKHHIPPTKPNSNIPTKSESNARPTGGDIAKAASAMQDKIASRPPIKEDSSLNRHKNVIRVSPRNRNDESPNDSSDSDTGPPPSVSVKSLKQSFEKSKKLSPRDSKISPPPLSPVKEDEALTNVIPPPPAFVKTNTASSGKVDSSSEDSTQKFGPLMDRFQKQDMNVTDMEIVPPPPSFMEDADQARFDTASVVSSVSSISTMSSFSTMSTDPSSVDGFEPIGEETLSNSNTLKSDTSSSGSSSSTLTAISTGENDNWIKTGPPVAAKPSKKVANENEANKMMSNKNDNDPVKDKSVSEWTVTDVGDWLERIKLGEYRQNFAENDITGEHLTSLAKDDLTELGVRRLGHRLTIIKALDKLKSV